MTRENPQATTEGATDPIDYDLGEFVHFHNRVTWEPPPDGSALLIHDVQPHYLNMLGTDVRTALVENLKQLIAACTAREIPVFASTVPQPLDPRDRGLMSDMWGGGPRTPTTQILAPELELPAHEVRMIGKRSYSAFFATDFEVSLRRLQCSSLIVTGLFASIGCLMTATDAFMRDFRTFFVADAVADFGRADHEHALRTASRTCARVLTVHEMREALSGRALRA